MPGEGFNIDHVLICPQGIFAIETKTWSLPWPAAKVVNREGKLLKAGFTPERDPVTQVSAAARWLQDTLSREDRLSVRDTRCRGGARLDGRYLPLNTVRSALLNRNNFLTTSEGNRLP